MVVFSYDDLVDYMLVICMDEPRDRFRQLYEKPVNSYSSVVVSKAKYEIYLQKDDIGIKLKFLGLNTLTIPNEVAKLWMPRSSDFLVGPWGSRTLGPWRLCSCMHTRKGKA